MCELHSELDNIADVDTCSITAVDGDSDNEIDEPPCIYHPTLEGFKELKKTQNKQFDKMRESKSFAMFKKRKENEGAWQIWSSGAKDFECENLTMFTARSMMSGYDAELDDFICYLYVMLQQQIETDLLQMRREEVMNSCDKQKNI
jgi:hypothetical protein